MGSRNANDVATVIANRTGNGVHPFSIGKIIDVTGKINQDTGKINFSEDFSGETSETVESSTKHIIIKKINDIENLEKNEVELLISLVKDLHDEVKSNRKKHK
ncbi:MAG: hypothetical protein OEW78_09075 [Nitrosopumilus sp.]|uniref:hypothetical protein n=1 Tax=Nitrosopumilus sp. TaxID=2024843 RepID=UPI0024723C41|nr:hypothetical protein [Nitrosopumilus sp.]MDH5432014.1 hypothetical protein [Nitrosopumilus sp.]